MELWIAVINTIVVGAVGVGLAWMGKGRFDALDRRIDRLEDRVNRLEERVETSINGLRSDITAVALAVGVPRAENG